MKRRKVFLLIWDGWGIAEDPALSAIDAAHTPFYDRVRAEYPFTMLKASGEAVGLPEGQMGNSEVGHLHIGAGFVVWQDLPRIQRALSAGELAHNPAWQALRTYLRKTGKPLHLLGLVSDGGIHSHISHLFGLLKALEDLPNPVYLHAFTDGRDTAPKAALSYLKEAEAALQALPQARLASIIGRYYAMDRDRRWERTRVAYRLLVHGEAPLIPQPRPPYRPSIRAALPMSSSNQPLLAPLLLSSPAMQCSSSTFAMTALGSSSKPSLRATSPTPTAVAPPSPCPTTSNPSPSSS
jgi:bisphosphoglycerate-independent phosphoglycerate mutase